MKNLNSLFIPLFIFLFPFHPAQLHAQDSLPVSVNKHIIKPFRIRGGGGLNKVWGRKTDNILEELQRQGFGDTESSRSTSDIFFAAFPTITSHPYPTRDQYFSSVFLWADGVLFKNLLIGFQKRRLTVEIKGFHFLYKSESDFALPGDYYDIGHHVKFRVATSMFEPKIGWISRSQHFCLYAGPAFLRHHFETADTKDVGFWGGAEGMLRGKRRGLLFLRFFAEYHFLPKVAWAGETISKDYKGQTYTSEFKGTNVDLSFYTLGIGTGLCF